VSETTPSSETPTTVEFDIESQREAVETFLTDLVTAFGRSDATVQVTVSTDGEQAIEAAIDGGELGLLVGQKGATLQAVQELVRSMVQRRFVGEPHARVRIDVAGYRARRKAALERFARDVAEGVKESGVAKALDPMGSSDRKVVHDIVNEIDGVVTASEGEDTARRVVIRPA
jgi:spoIIIJ-associated protein